MKLSLLALALLSLSMSFSAAATEQDAIEQVAREAGVSTRMVRMVLGNRTSFSEYRTSYDRVARRVHSAAVRLAAQEQETSDRAAYVAIADISER